MSTVLHFLVIYDIQAGEADLVPFDTDYEAALEAYNGAEKVHRDDTNTEVVLLGSDSVETLRRTHSSYFELSERHIDQIVARELAELGLR
ncbi:MAG TPA: hypothetical protein VMG80_07610 [Solirubrobacteraceae bacterium]|nr:hypothetical protein [Solirubrobacteraceae bacterium]